MDTDLKCNRLTCRRVLTDKAVVTTCSHIFCVECANELFNAARLCPACETSLLEPDDVVICSLHPSNDYKTSVLSGLSPSTILEICNRAISFWQYQIHQENSFQQALVRNINDKNAQLQKQLENVIREANGEINLFSNKIAELERDLELERRKVRDLQDSSREREKEYQKLKIQHDKIKRRALLAPSLPVHDNTLSLSGPQDTVNGDQHTNVRTFGTNITNAVNFGAVVGDMEANGVRIQRTPVVNRTIGGLQHNGTWSQYQQGQGQVQARNQPQRQPYGYRSGNTSDRSESANEVDNMLTGGVRQASRAMNQGGWGTAAHRTQQTQRAFVPPTNKRTGGGFRPAGVPR